MPATLREFRYRPPWFAILAFAYLGVMLIPNAVVLVTPFYWSRLSLAIPSRVVLSLVLLLPGIAGAYFMYFALRMIASRFKQSQRIVLTEDGVTMPRRVWSSEKVFLPYREVTRARHAFSRFTRRVDLFSAQGTFVIRSSVLPGKGDFDDLLRILSERLAGVGVQIEAHELWFGGRWTRPQFSLMSLMLFTTVVAALLGIRLCVDKEFHRGELLALAYVLALGGIPFLALLPGRKWGIAFVVGYLGGMVFEWSALTFLNSRGLLQFVPGTLTCSGWFPFCLPIGRLLVAAGWADPLRGVLWSMWAGQIASGIVVGTAIAALWQSLAWAVSRKRSNTPNVR